jgi:prevent-host-death family protein
MAKRKIGAEEARARLPKLLELAHHGHTTVVTRRGEPYAVVAPVEQAVRTKGKVLDLRGTGEGLWGSDASRTLRRMRDEWQ